VVSQYLNILDNQLIFNTPYVNRKALLVKESRLDFFLHGIGISC